MLKKQREKMNKKSKVVKLKKRSQYLKKSQSCIRLRKVKALLNFKLLIKYYAEVYAQ